MTGREAVTELWRVMAAILRREGPVAGLLSAYFSLLAGEKC